MNELVERLSKGDHPVEARVHPEKSLENLKKRLTEMGYVHIKFTNTKGGTELGVRVDQGETDLSNADFDNGTGTAHVVGGLILNYVKVKCIADIDIKTFEGKGHLVPLAEVTPAGEERPIGGEKAGSQASDQGSSEEKKKRTVKSPPSKEQKSTGKGKADKTKASKGKTTKGKTTKKK